MTLSEQELLARFNVTAEQLDEWADEYENTDWTHMRFGRVRVGRPPLTNEDLTSVTVKIPESRATALDRIQAQTGITKSEFIRRAIDHELIRQAQQTDRAA